MRKFRSTIIELPRDIMDCGLMLTVYREEFESADAYLEQLRPSRTFAEAEITFEIIILQIELHRKKQDYQMALHITNTTIRELKQSPRAG